MSKKFDRFCFPFLFRFHLALQKLQEGQSLVERMDNGLGINTNCEYWPGTNELIEESNLNSLKVRGFYSWYEMRQ